MQIARALWNLFPCACLAATVSAQGIQLDFGAPVPSPSFGAASGQTGSWQLISCLDSACPSVALLDPAGQSTTATITFEPGSVLTSPLVCPLPALNADERALLEGGQAYSTFGTLSARIDGLAPGVYDVFLYASLRCNGFSSSVSVSVNVLGSPTGPLLAHAEELLDLEVSAGAFEAHGNFTRVRIVLGVGQSLQIRDGGEHLLNGLQIVPIAGNATPVCFGSDEALNTMCPCGPGAFARGCPSSFDAGGAELTGAGASSVSGDSLVLSAAAMSPSFVTFFQGTTLVQSLAAIHFGDGNLCASGALIRLVTKQAISGAAVYPAAGELAISTQGQIPLAGGTRVYQVAYRDAFPFCTSATFNSTNAVLVSWMP